MSVLADWLADRRDERHLDALPEDDKFWTDEDWSILLASGRRAAKKERKRLARSAAPVA